MVLLKFRTVEQVLLATLGLPPEGKASLLARIKRFMQLGVPAAAKVGSGKASYRMSDILEMALALTMTRAGMSIHIVARFITENRKKLQPLWARATANQEQTLLIVRMDTMAAPQAVVPKGGKGSVLKGVALLGPWDLQDERILPVTTIDLVQLAPRVTTSLKIVRAARIVAAELSLSDEVIAEALAEVTHAPRNLK